MAEDANQNFFNFIKETLCNLQQKPLAVYLTLGHFKGTGTRDLSWLKEVSLERS